MYLRPCSRHGAHSRWRPSTARECWVEGRSTSLTSSQGVSSRNPESQNRPANQTASACYVLREFSAASVSIVVFLFLYSYSPTKFSLYPIFWLFPVDIRDCWNQSQRHYYKAWNVKQAQHRKLSCPPHKNYVIIIFGSLIVPFRRMTHCQKFTRLAACVRSQIVRLAGCMSVDLLGGLLPWLITWQTDGQPIFPLPTKLRVYLGVLPIKMPACRVAYLFVSLTLPSCPSALLPAYQSIDQSLCFTGWAGGYGNLPNMNSTANFSTIK